MLILTLRFITFKNPMKYLTKHMPFPDVSEATEEGLLAIGGDLSTR